MQLSENAGKQAVLIAKYNNVDDLVFLKSLVLDQLVLTYKGWHVYRLVDWLELLPDNYFFN